MPSITRKARTSTDRRAVEKRILSSANDLLKGGTTFTELSIGAIANAAGVARSTFYVHFADKTDLLKQLVAEAAEDLFAVASEWLGTNEIDGPARLAAMLRQFLSISRRKSHIYSAVMEAMAYDSDVDELWNDQLGELTTQLKVMLSVAAENGNLADEVNLDHLAEIAAWSIERNVSRQVLHAHPSSDSAFAESMGRALWLMFFGDAGNPPEINPATNL